MKTFTITAHEIVYYQWEIEAETQAEAQEKIYGNEVEFEPVDASDFQIDEVIEHTGE